MTQSRSQKPFSRSSKGAKAVRRAIAKSNLAKEPPTVGKPVIDDPVEALGSRPVARKRGGTPSRQDDGR
jgi:hypothetical protein